MWGRMGAARAVLGAIFTVLAGGWGDLGEWHWGVRRLDVGHCLDMGIGMARGGGGGTDLRLPLTMLEMGEGWRKGGSVTGGGKGRRGYFLKNREAPGILSAIANFPGLPNDDTAPLSMPFRRGYNGCIEMQHVLATDVRKAGFQHRWPTRSARIAAGPGGNRRFRI